MQRLAEAELGSMEAEVDARIGELLAELDRARTLTALYRDEVIPEGHANVESAFSSYRVGNVDFMTLVDAQMTVNRYEGELYQLLGDYGKAVAALESAVGRPLPSSRPDPGGGTMNTRKQILLAVGIVLAAVALVAFKMGTRGEEQAAAGGMEGHNHAAMGGGGGRAEAGHAGRGGRAPHRRDLRDGGARGAAPFRGARWARWPTTRRAWPRSTPRSRAGWRSSTWTSPARR